VTQPLSVVIATRGRPELLARCLRSARAALGPDDEIVVVDSSPDPAPGERIGRECAARVLQTGPGASHQRNIGVLAAKNDVIAFIDDDVQVSSEWADGVREGFSCGPGVAFVTGRIQLLPGQEGYSRPVSIKDDPEPAELTTASRGTLGHGANFAVRKGPFQEVGGFDEQLGPGAPLHAAEDNELMDRLLMAGYTGRYEPRALAWHDQWRDRRDLVKLEWSYGIGTGARLARLARRDRPRARDLATEDLWDNGVRDIPALARAGYEFGVAYVLARLAGTSVGYLRARRSGFADDVPPRLV